MRKQAAKARDHCRACANLRLLEQIRDSPAQREGVPAERKAETAQRRYTEEDLLWLKRIWSESDFLCGTTTLFRPKNC